MIKAVINLDLSLYSLCSTITGKRFFSRKKKLKNPGISITESLTKLRMGKLAKAKEEFGFRNVWTVDGRICYIGEGSQFPKAYFN